MKKNAQIFLNFQKKEQKQIKTQIRHKIAEQYTIVRYNGVSKERLEQYKKDGFLDNKLVIVDESHNVVSMMTNYVLNPTNVSSHMRGRLLYELFMNAKNTRFIFLSGTPIMNYPKELAVLFNVLRGPTHIFKYTFKTKNTQQFEKYMKEFPYIDYIHIYNNTLEVSQTPLGFAIKNGEIYKHKDAPKTHVQWVQRLKSYVSNGNATIDTVHNTQQDTFHCFPVDETFEQAFVQDENIKNTDVFMRRIMGMVSYYGDDHKQQTSFSTEKQVYIKEGFPEMTIHPIEEVEMSNTQYVQYEQERMKEIRNDTKKAARNMSKMFEDEGKDITTYRARSLALCNFAFPLSIEANEPIVPQNRDKILQELKTKLDTYTHSSTIKT